MLTDHTDFKVKWLMGRQVNGLALTLAMKRALVATVARTWAHMIDEPVDA